MISPDSLGLEVRARTCYEINIDIDIDLMAVQDHASSSIRRNLMSSGYSKSRFLILFRTLAITGSDFARSMRMISRLVASRLNFLVVPRISCRY